MQISDFYWLRQPLISIERLLAALAQDRLNDLLKEEKVTEAIRIAWPSVSDHLREGVSTDPKVAETILKYILRLSTRCTPFGLFAGGAVGFPAATSVLDFTDRQLLAQHRLDTQVLLTLAYKLSSQPAIRTSLRYYANRSVYQIGNRLRYVESHWLEGQWHYYASEVTAEQQVLTVLSLAQHGATISDLVQALATEEHQTEANEFIERLIEDSLLVSELLPAPTGSDPLTSLIQKLDGLTPAPPVLVNLHHIQSLLSQSKPWSQSAKVVTEILTGQMGLTLEPNCVLQTDMGITGGSNQLSRNVLDQLQQTLSSLHVLNLFNTEIGELTAFKQRFYARYEEQEVPLLLALDDDTGVGYTSMLEPLSSVHELMSDLLTHSSAKSITTFQADKLHTLRLKLYSEWLPQSCSHVEITDQDLANLGSNDVPLPDSYYAFGHFLASSSAAIDAGRYQFSLKALTGPSAFTLMGRFCTANKQLEDLVTAHMVRQQANHPNRLFAEIVHLPQARTGNVVQRPHLRPYEIPYLTPSSLPYKQQLFPDDLLISIPNGQRIVVRSKRLSIEVIPQLTTAHDYRDSLPLYKFLCDLQHQDIPFSVGWHWGALAKARRLPRVQYRNIILQEAIWSFLVKDLLPTLSDDQNITQLRINWQLPSLVAIQQGDQELFLDLESPACRQLFISTLRRLEMIQVVEWLRTPDNCPVKGPDGKLTHEVIIPFVRATNSYSAKSLIANNIPTDIPTSQRNFPPGSEWLYLKVYCGPSAARAVLSQLIQVACQAVDKSQITHWYFIRYEDPDPHLRIRLRLKDLVHYSSLLSTLQQGLAAFLSSGEVHRFQIDTYQRELERYGDVTINQTEYIFWRDSETVSQLLQLDLTESSFLSAALLGVDSYQTAFGLTSSEKLLLCEQLFSELYREHGATGVLRQKLAQKYRLNQSLVLKLLKQETREEEDQLYQLVQRHQERIRYYVADIRELHSAQDRDRRWRYISSLGHLFINRLFSVNQRTYELLVYHHLYRAHQSIAARPVTHPD